MSEVIIQKELLAEALMSLERVYHRILKVNLTTGTHQDIKMYASENVEEFGYSEDIGKWLHDFAKAGMVHPEDMEQYLNYTDMEFLRDYFRDSEHQLLLRYRRKIHGKYRRVIMFMMKSDEYTDDQQIVLLYIQDVDHEVCV